MKKRTRTYLLAVIGFFVLIAFVDSMGAFDTKSWIEIPHGSHSHYLPKDYTNCVPPLSVGDGPTSRPGPGETVDCDANVVPEQ